VRCNLPHPCKAIWWATTWTSTCTRVVRTVRASTRSISLITQCLIIKGSNYFDKGKIAIHFSTTYSLALKIFTSASWLLMSSSLLINNISPQSTGSHAPLWRTTVLCQYVQMFSCSFNDFKCINPWIASRVFLLNERLALKSLYTCQMEAVVVNGHISVTGRLSATMQVA